MKKKILWVTLLINGAHLMSQNLQWVKMLESNMSDQGQAIIADQVGNVYITGAFSGSADFDPGPGTTILTAQSGSDVFVMKMDVYGHLKWARRVGANQDDAGHDVAVDANGNVYYTGWYKQTVDFNPGIGTANLTSLSGSYDVFISKLDSSGNFQWAKTIGTSNDDDGSAITIDNWGNVYVTGYFAGTCDFDPGASTYNLTSAGSSDIFVLKLNSNGDFKWVATAGSISYDWGKGIVTDQNGSVYITGSYVSSPDMNPGPGFYNLVMYGNLDVFVWKLDSARNFQWARGMGGPEQDRGMDIGIDHLGEVVIIGSFEDTADLDPTAGVINTPVVGNSDVYVCKLDGAGNLIWSKSYGGPDWDIPSRLAIGADRNIYTSGYFIGNCDFDPGPSSYNLSSPNIYSDIYVQKLDSNGNFNWADRFGAGLNDWAWGLGIDPYGSVLATGTFANNVDFDPTAGVYIQTSTGYEMYILKLCQAQTPGIVGTPGPIIGNQNVCPGTVNTYSIPEVLGAGWYVWSLPVGWFGNSDTNGITATANGGSGDITVMAVTGCDTTVISILSITVANCAGVEDNEFASVYVYPNPSSGNIYFTGLNMEMESYRIVNLLGSIVQTGIINTDNSINFGAIPNGTYFLHVGNRYWKILQVD